MVGRTVQIKNFHANFFELIELHEFQIYVIEKFV